MFADQTLTPKEAVRFCALGLAAEAPRHYAALAGGVRHFCGRIAGPSLDLMGTSIELLRYEGLVQAVEGNGMEDDALFTVTDELKVVVLLNDCGAVNVLLEFPTCTDSAATTELVAW